MTILPRLVHRASTRDIVASEKKSNRDSKGCSHVGAAGQLAMMSELAWRGYNVAIPNIDVGYDILAINDAKPDYTRLQVKGANPKKQKNSDCYQFKIRKGAIDRAYTDGVYVAFAMRVEKGWKFLILDGAVLHNYVESLNVGSRSDNGRYRRFDIILGHDGRVSCSKIDWSNHFEDWRRWPAL